LRLLLDIMLGENAKRINKVPSDRPIRILFQENDGGSPLASPVHPEIVHCVRKTVHHLERKFGVKAQVNCTPHLTSQVHSIARSFKRVDFKYTKAGSLYSFVILRVKSNHTMSCLIA